MILDDRLPLRLQTMLTPEPNCGCWLYVGRWNSGNCYAKCSWEGRDRMLHIVVYELIVGPVPPGLLLDHLCRVRWCSNPYHMEPVTVGVNTRRGNATLFKRRDEYA